MGWGRFDHGPTTAPTRGRFSDHRLQGLRGGVPAVFSDQQDRVTLEGKRKKDPTEEDREALIALSKSGHQGFNSSFYSSLKGGTGMENKFASFDGEVPVLKSRADSSSAKSCTDSSKGARSSKKAKTWDQEANVGRAMRACAAKVTGLIDSSSCLQEKANAIVKSVTGDEMKAAVQRAMDTQQSRMPLLSAVLWIPEAPPIGISTNQ